MGFKSKLEEHNEEILRSLEVNRAMRKATPRFPEQIFPGFPDFNFLAIIKEQIFIP